MNGNGGGRKTPGRRRIARSSRLLPEATDATVARRLDAHASRLARRGFDVVRIGSDDGRAPKPLPKPTPPLPTAYVCRNARPLRRDQLASLDRFARHPGTAFVLADPGGMTHRLRTQGLDALNERIGRGTRGGSMLASVAAIALLAMAATALPPATTDSGTARRQAATENEHAWMPRTEPTTDDQRAAPPIEDAVATASPSATTMTMAHAEATTVAIEPPTRPPKPAKPSRPSATVAPEWKPTVAATGLETTPATQPDVALAQTVAPEPATMPRPVMATLPAAAPAEESTRTEEADAPGLVVRARAGETLATIYRRSYASGKAPPFAEFERMNRLPIHAGTIVFVPMPDGAR